MASRPNSCTAHALRLVHPLKGHQWGTGQKRCPARARRTNVPPYVKLQRPWVPDAFAADAATPPGGVKHLSCWTSSKTKRSERGACLELGCTHHSHCISSGVRRDMLWTIWMKYNVFMRHGLHTYLQSNSNVQLER
jgi:hypothetical protein